MPLIRFTKSTHGKDAIIDNNYHKYTLNRIINETVKK